MFAPVMDGKRLSEPTSGNEDEDELEDNEKDKDEDLASDLGSSQNQRRHTSEENVSESGSDEEESVFGKYGKASFMKIPTRSAKKKDDFDRL